VIPARATAGARHARAVRQHVDMAAVVGITSYVEQARWGVWDVPAALLPFRYVERVEAAGGRAVVLPPSAADDGSVLDRLDAVVFAGGSDLDPRLYGADPHAETTGLRPERDAAEVPLMRAALDRDLPVLGICRGMQLLAVVCGGSLVQHLPDAVGHERHRPTPGVYGLHDVRLEPGSKVAAILGDHVSVPSYHHQGLDSPGSLRVTGWADDGTPEAVEHPDRRFVLGVLWHPEAGDDVRLFTALVAAARSTAAS
jgi:putative glutamine amidotransferase